MSVIASSHKQTSGELDNTIELAGCGFDSRNLASGETQSRPETRQVVRRSLVREKSRDACPAPRPRYSVDDAGSRVPALQPRLARRSFWEKARLFAEGELHRAQTEKASPDVATRHQATC